MKFGWMGRLGIAVTLATTAAVASGVDRSAAVEALREISHPLRDEGDLEVLLDATADRRLVLLGEATHGTHEFYHWRAALSRKLIEGKDFDFIAVEGDWNAIAHLDRYVRHLDGAAGSARDALLAIDRWPLWMWANEEVAELGEWLHEWNRDRPPGERTGIHGIDVYGMWDSYGEVVRFYAAELPEHFDLVNGHYAILRQFAGDDMGYMRYIANQGFPAEAGVRQVAEKLAGRYATAEGAEREALFDAWQHAKVVQYGEAHVRTRHSDGRASWNARTTHFMRTVSRLLEFYGTGSKGIVWAHNTHIGDSTAMEMGRFGQVNIGQLAREALGRDRVFAVGFGTARGTVHAAREWEGARETMEIPEPAPDSVEAMLTEAGGGDRILVWGDPPPPALRGEIPHRAIGVVYQPGQETRGNYVPTVLTERYDAFIFLPETRSLRALQAGGDGENVGKCFHRMRF